MGGSLSEVERFGAKILTNCTSSRHGRCARDARARPAVIIAALAAAVGEEGKTG